MKRNGAIVASESTDECLGLCESWVVPRVFVCCNTRIVKDDPELKEHASGSMYMLPSLISARVGTSLSFHVGAIL
jgi:hypothetical protein